MDIAFIERLIEMVANSPIEELELEREGWRVRIVKAARQAPASAPVQRASEAIVPAQASPATKAGHLIRAPLTGTFYRSASEGGPPMVVPGDSVEEGQAIGILEAMKMLNPIEADRAGRIVEILVENAQAVQAGDPLFTLEAS